jgi:hypothetical protein
MKAAEAKHAQRRDRAAAVKEARKNEVELPAVDARVVAEHQASLREIFDDLTSSSRHAGVLSLREFMVGLRRSSKLRGYLQVDSDGRDIYRRMMGQSRDQRVEYVKDSLYIQCSEIFTLRIEKLHTETPSH